MRGMGLISLVTEKPESESRPVLLFDGECGLCNRVVRLLLRLDRTGRLFFAPLQGPAAQSYLLAQGLPTQDFSTIVYVPDWRRQDRRDFLLRTDGIVAALRTAGGVGNFLGAALAVVPTACRDAGYKLVARWRYRVFGPWRACPLPKPEWKARFLE
jgi:predicted DCC family thiol-disulfide oxidoreductase YuxK